MIKLTVIDAKTDHFLLQADEPIRIEVSLLSLPRRSVMMAHVYRGAEVDPDQEPVGVYDGSLPVEDWSDELPREA